MAKRQTNAVTPAECVRGSKMMAELSAPGIDAFLYDRALLLEPRHLFLTRLEIGPNVRQSTLRRSDSHFGRSKILREFVSSTDVASDRITDGSDPCSNFFEFRLSSRLVAALGRVDVGALKEEGCGDGDN